MVIYYLPSNVTDALHHYIFLMLTKNVVETGPQKFSKFAQDYAAYIKDGAMVQLQCFSELSFKLYNKH